MSEEKNRSNYYVLREFIVGIILRLLQFYSKNLMENFYCEYIEERWMNKTIDWIFVLQKRIGHCEYI